MITDILILGAVIVVAGLFALLSAVSFMRLNKNGGPHADNRH
jgi:hypothetical protein